MKVNIFYKDEFIATGETSPAPWAFWTYIKPSPETDVERVVARLSEIEKDFGVRFEATTAGLGFPPAYRVKESEELTWAFPGVVKTWPIVGDE